MMRTLYLHQQAGISLPAKLCWWAIGDGEEAGPFETEEEAIEAGERISGSRFPYWQ
jgi:hypothetical protein